MRLNAPKKKVFWLTVVIAAVAVVAFVVGLFTLPVISYISFGVMTVAYVLIVLGNVLKGF